MFRERAGHADYLAAMAAAVPVCVLIAAAGDQNLSPHWPGARIALVMLVAAPILEETVFRAGIQDGIACRLRVRLGPLSAANGLTALLFWLAHTWQHASLWAAATVLPSLVFGYFYERYRHLAAPVMLHVAYNAAFIMLLAPGPPGAFVTMHSG